MDSIVPIQVTRVSDNFDPNISYTPRSQRKEWTTVGLLGKIHVRDDGNCVEGEKCSCENGIAVPGTDWFVMKRVSPNVIKILYK